MNNFLRLLSYLKPYRRRFSLALLLALLTVASDLVVPMLFGWTINRGLASGQMRLVVLFAGLLVLAQGFKSLTDYLQWLVQQQVGQDVVRDIRDQLYVHLQALPESFYRQMPTGQIMSRLTSDVESVQEYLGWGFIIQIMAAVSLLGTTILLFLLDWQLTLIIYLPMLGLVVIVYHFDKRIGPAWEGVRERMGEMTTILQENISGVRVVKTFAREPLEASRFQKHNERNRRSNQARLRLEANAIPSMDLMVGLTFVLLSAFGGWRIINGHGNIGLFFAYQWYLWGILWPMRFLGWLVSVMRQALAAAPRLFEIIDAPLDNDDEPDAVELGHVKGEIVFEDVAFAFADDPERWVLQGLDLRIAPGEVVAILGGTGSGKSSLVDLVGRFKRAGRGRVLLDGVDVCQVTAQSLRRNIGIVPQESFLFSATVRENIAYGWPDAPAEKVIRAARLAQAHEFIEQMQAGYDTQIGERGMRLSGGQKQRLSLARAILIDPPIFILDEATSAVDTRTEHEIQRALASVMAGRTSIIVAQRLSTVKHADRVVVLKDGAVVESGTHAELLALNGEYARIYELQYGEGRELTRKSKEYGPAAAIEAEPELAALVRPV